MYTTTRPFDTTAGVDPASLQEKRSVGDCAADAAVKEWLEHDPDRSLNRRSALTALANNLVGFDRAPELDELMRRLRDAEAVHGLPPAHDQLALDDHEEALAEDLFTDHGLKILMILVFYSLPAAYAAFRGVPVLHSNSGGTGFLVKDVNRRLIETTQFVLEVLTAVKPKRTPRRGDAPHDLAIASAQRVRLLHAVVRRMILDHGWDKDALGIPVNQEDMAGTFLTFSWVVLDGMRRLNLQVSPEKERVFYDMWRQIAPSLGLDPLLVRPTTDGAEQLTTLIRARQVYEPIEQGRDNVFGKKMACALLEFLGDRLPWPLKGSRRLPASVIRFFLPTAPFDVATSIGIPRTYVLDEFVRVWFFIEAHITRYRVFDAANRIVFKEWGRQDDRARSLMQFSRFFMRRFVMDMQSRDRTAALDVKQRTKNIDLLGWDERWQFDQASFVTRGVRSLFRSVRARPR
jgi:ER-bound oxygenase mpaB/B'/Rubber oxygenase, catalytic domain